MDKPTPGTTPKKRLGCEACNVDWAGACLAEQEKVRELLGQVKALTARYEEQRDLRMMAEGALAGFQKKTKESLDSLQQDRDRCQRNLARALGYIDRVNERPRQEVLRSPEGEPSLGPEQESANVRY